MRSSRYLTFWLTPPSRMDIFYRKQCHYLSFEKRGIIDSIDMSFTEVEILEEGLHCVPWYNIRNHFKIGDYACVSSSPDYNTKGWVIDINKNFATIIRKAIEGETNKYFDNPMNVSYYKTVHVNLTMFTDHQCSFELPHRCVNTFSTCSQNSAHFSHFPAYKRTQTSLVRNQYHHF